MIYGGMKYKSFDIAMLENITQIIIVNFKIYCDIFLGAVKIIQVLLLSSKMIIELYEMF